MQTLQKNEAINAKVMAKRLDALFKDVEEHKKDPEYMKALEEVHSHLSHKEAGK